MGKEFFIEGKKYISASRASKISGYNSDYIGQLCRKSQIKCLMVGRSWFVEEESLKNHKVVASNTPRGRGVKRIEISDQPAVLATIDTSSVQQKVEPTSSSITNTLWVRKSSIKKGVTGISKKTPSSTEIRSSKYAFHSFHADVREYKKETGVQVQNKKTLRNIGFAIAVIVLLTAVSSKFIFPDNGLKQQANPSVASTAHVSQTTLDQVKDRYGVVVVPSANNEGINNQVKQYVTDSFSDEAKIVPDKNGNAGLIQPVFKDKKDQEYLYVVVPMKDHAN